MLTLVVPAAGRGSRLSAVCRGRPKCLIEVGGRPILHYAIDAGLLAPVDRIVIVVSPAGGEIREAIGRHYAGVPVTYVEQAVPLGLAHAVTMAAPHVVDAMLVVNGDEVYVDSQHDWAWTDFHDNAADAVIGYRHTDDPRRITIGYGLDVAADGRVLRLDEKPARPWNDVLGVGTWFLRRSWFDRYASTPVNPQRGERDFVAVIQAMLETGCRVRGCELGGRFFNINTEADLEWARSALRPVVLEHGLSLAAAP